jgi:hypothetical protein
MIPSIHEKLAPPYTHLAQLASSLNSNRKIFKKKKEKKSSYRKETSVLACLAKLFDNIGAARTMKGFQVNDGDGDIRYLSLREGWKIGNGILIGVWKMLGPWQSKEAFSYLQHGGRHD